MKLMKKPRGSLRVLPAAAAAAAAVYCNDAELFPPSITGWFITVLHCSWFHHLNHSFQWH